jgi:hypothetical protein
MSVAEINEIHNIMPARRGTFMVISFKRLVANQRSYACIAGPREPPRRCPKLITREPRERDPSTYPGARTQLTPLTIPAAHDLYELPPL